MAEWSRTRLWQPFCWSFDKLRFVLDHPHEMDGLWLLVVLFVLVLAPPTPLRCRAGIARILESFAGILLRPLYLLRPPRALASRCWLLVLLVVMAVLVAVFFAVEDLVVLLRVAMAAVLVMLGVSIL